MIHIKEAIVRKKSLAGVERIVRGIVRRGATGVSVEIADGRVTGLQYRLPGGEERHVGCMSYPRKGVGVAMGSVDLARLLTVEYRCERCQKRMSAGMFDRSMVCDPCQKAMELRLVRHG